LGITDLQRFMGSLRDRSKGNAGVVELLESHRARLLDELAKMSIALDVLDGGSPTTARRSPGRRTRRTFVRSDPFERRDPS
jgi:hypothetical protein